MANTNGAVEVAKTPSKDQDANGQVEPTEEEGAGQLPDSMLCVEMHIRQNANNGQTSSKSRSNCPTSPSKCP
jgi:hypothetical protein